jgi:putative ABC transport system permease protein
MRDPHRGSWVRRVFRVDRGVRGLERDVDAELAFHLEMRTRKLIANGLSPDAARAGALSQFGDYRGVRDECLIINRKRERRMQLADFWANVRQDARYAVRSLVEHRVFSLVVLLTLAIGIGANTAIFSVVDALLLRTLPVPHPEQLVTIGNPAGTGTFAQGSESVDVFSNPIYTDLRDRNDVFSGTYAIGQLGTADMFAQENRTSGDRVPEHPVGRFVTGNYFDVLQVHARIGRTFTGAEDTAPNADPFVVISDAYWQRRFAGDPGVVGRRISINGAALTIVGVMPPTFSGDIVGGHTDLWVPMMMLPALTGSPARLTDRSTSWLLFMGRLAPGKTLAQAEQAVRGVIAQSLKTNMSDSNWTRFERNLRTDPIKVGEGSHGFSSVRSVFGPAILIMLAAVAVVLLVVCANVANLMLARAAARAREISVRLALGASRARLVQQLLTESVLIAAVAAVLGLAFASWGTRAMLVVAAQGRAPIPLDARLDARVLGYTCALTLVTAILFGLLPALRATRVEVASALRTQGHGGSGSLRGTSRVRLPLAKALVIAQVGLSVLLLVGTGVLVRSMQRVAQADLGLARDHLLIVGVDAQHRGYQGARLSALLSDLTARATRVPGVAGVSYSTNGIFNGTESFSSIRVPGFEIRADSDRFVAFDAVGPGYFRAVGTTLLRGRGIESGDDARAAKVAVLNETMAKYYFKNADAVGKTLVRKDSTYTIVGIVHDVEEQDVRAAPVRRMYLSIDQATRLPGYVNFTIRAAGDPAALVEPMRAAFTAADAALPVSATPVNTLVGNSVSQSLLMTQVISFFGALTLLLAALGLYGVMAFTTARRTGEFGLRIALGASGGDVTRMVLREALALVAVGLAVGLPAGLGAVRLIRNELFQVGTFDPVTAIAAAVLLALVAVIAAGLPAVRASRVAPVEALRAD